MTQRKHLKQLVRARMQKTGERYASARRNVLGAQVAEPAARARGAAFHLPGNIPATTALRVVLTAAGVRDPHTRQPFSEAMLFGIAGGIGIGVFSFLYEKQNFASFFVGGRHLWQDYAAYLNAACTRVGARTTIKESSGTKPGEKMLRDLLASGAPCIAWLEMGLLPHRATPSAVLGGGYYLVTVYEIDDDAKTALIGDLTDEPMVVPLQALAAARARIKQFKHRLLSVSEAGITPPLDKLVRDGLTACHRGLLGAGAMKGAKGNFTLGALDTWAERLVAPAGKDSWVHVYAPGPRLWNGLTMLHDCVEHYGTGGGLCRPLFADFLHQASSATGNKALAQLGDRYAELGRQWGELAQEALPDEVPALREARELLVRRAELLASGDATGEERRVVREQLDTLAAKCGARFPISAAAYTELRTRLHDRVLALHAGEVAAHGMMGTIVDGR